MLYSTTRFNRKQNIVNQVYQLHKKWDKKIFFGELGFPRKNGASIEPWNPNISDSTNNIEQADCFKAYKKVFNNKLWFLGFSIFSIGTKKENHFFYPSKESINVLKNWNGGIPITFS